MLTLKEIEGLVRIARHELLAQFADCSDRQNHDLGNSSGNFVNVTLRRGGLICGSMGGTGLTLGGAVKLAVQRASRDERFGRPILRGDLDNLAIELWIETGRTSLAGDCADWSSQMRLGRDGVTVSLGASSAYYKPSVALTKSIATTEELLGKLCRKAKLPELAWQEPQANVEVTNWIHAVEIGPDVVLLEALRPAQTRIAEPDNIRDAAALVMKRLLSIQKPDGSLGYLYNPFDDRWDSSSSRVRLAGCAYALARAADHPVFQCDRRYILGTASRVLEYLFAQVSRLESGGLSFIREADCGQASGKLGATALTVLAAQHTAGEPFNAQCDALITTLLDLQSEDGRFTCGIGREEGATAQDFFPGETLLALVSYAKRTGDQRVFAVLSRAFPYYKSHFYVTPSSAFVVWQADAWTRVSSCLRENHLTRIGSDGPTVEEISDFIFDQIDWLIDQQYSRNVTDRTEYVGGFKVPHSPTASSAAFVEAIIRSLEVAAIVGDDARLQRYRECALIGLQFIMRLQILPETSAFFPRPLLVIGAMTKSLESFELRCDYDQHFLTACLTALDLSDLLWN